MDRADYEQIASQLRGLLIRLGDRLSAGDANLVAEFIDANELGLALEQLADALSEDERNVSAAERADMLELVARMEMSGPVARALESCPER